MLLQILTLTGNFIVGISASITMPRTKALILLVKAGFASLYNMITKATPFLSVQAATMHSNRHPTSLKFHKSEIQLLHSPLNKRPDPHEQDAHKERRQKAEQGGLNTGRELSIFAGTLV